MTPYNIFLLAWIRPLHKVFLIKLFEISNYVITLGMRSKVNTDTKTIIAELAEAISSYNIAGIEELLSADGDYTIQNEKNEIIKSGKDRFIEWLGECYHESVPSGRFRRRLRFTIVQCLHCVTGNPIIIFDNGNFPVFSGIRGKDEKSGLVIRYAGNKITGIEFCFLAMKTENPFIYEKRCLRPGF